jgi:asparagine synthase (glutamine-hydrolysing)
MCGIFGALSTTAVDVAATSRASRTLRHRGPDADGMLLANGDVTRVVYGEERVPDAGYTVALASRRLSIIDVSGGTQPLANEDGSVWCVLNGEIYNYRALRDALAGRGHVFRTKSDTEVLCHGWEEWGTDIVRHLHGMFAFAIYDRRRDVLALVRDHAGIKPLYYYQAPGTFAFASEVKALLAYDPAIEVCRESVLDFFLFDQVPPPRTPYRGVSRVDAGELCVVRGRDLAMETRTRYWDFPMSRRAWASRADVVAAVDDTLRRVVAKQAVSDVPVATFLSGGIDSSLVTRALMEEVPDLTAFHLDAGGSLSERRWTTNPGFGDLHRVYVPYEATLERCVDALATVDALLFDPGILPMHEVSRAVAAAGFKVVLSGDGGDEMFAGYDSTFHAAHLFERARPFGVRWWGRLPVLRHVLRAGDADELARYARYGSCLDVYGTRVNNLLSTRKVAHVGGPSGPHLPGDGLLPTDAADDRTDLERLSYFYCRYVLDNILEKVDLASMASSVEVRVPLLDVEMMELALSIPIEHKVAERGKAPLKALAARYFGREFAYRTKQGFGVDVGGLFGAPAVDAYLREGVKQAGIDEFLDVASIERMIDENRGRPAYGKVLWRALMFTEWYRRWGARHA